MTDMSAIGWSRGRLGRQGMIDRHDLVATLDRAVGERAFQIMRSLRLDRGPSGPIHP